MKLRKAVIVVMAVNRLKKTQSTNLYALEQEQINRCVSLFQEKPFVSIVELISDKLTKKTKGG